MSEWISVKDRLPGANGSYIICTDRLRVCAAHYYPDWRRWNKPFDGHVLYWMEFPKPPLDDYLDNLFE